MISFGTSDPGEGSKPKAQILISSSKERINLLFRGGGRG